MRLFMLLLLSCGVTVGIAAAEKETLNVKEISFFKPYSLNVCIVSDEAFGGDMGDPISFVYKDQEYTICCKSCIKQFAKNPDKFVDKLKKAKEPKKDAKVEKHDHGGHKHDHKH